MYRVSKCAICELPAFKKNCIVACISGTFFASGWWILFDLQTNYTEFMEEHAIYHLPGVVATLTLLLINLIPLAALQGSVHYSYGALRGKGTAVLCLFLGLMAAFGTMIGATYIWIAEFLLDKSVIQWPGYAILLQNLFIFISNLSFRFGRQETS
ncbi:hypothetical protein HHI36_015550 [Cryptolaemus montrouzieri]|uniref:Transmembrane protein 50B n=1 Tax=Cryptolaemus montrouzieri TaxID=559131 RepID=A0ABD2N7E3_9CUCU